MTAGRGGVEQEPVHGGVAELRAFAHAVSGVVQKSADGADAAVLREEFVHAAHDRRFLRIGYELVTLVAVAEGRLPAELLAKLRADRDGGRDAGADLLALPGRHRRNHGVEEASRRR